MGKVREHEKGIWTETIPPSASRELRREAEERELKLRPDYILEEKEMKSGPEYIKIERKRYEEEKRRNRKLWQAINGLSRMQKTFFVMHHDMDFSIKQLAKDFKVSEATVKEHTQRAKKNLRRRLAGQLQKGKSRKQKRR